MVEMGGEEVRGGGEYPKWQEGEDEEEGVEAVEESVGHEFLQLPE
jgi:hypothetical protein